MPIVFDLLEHEGLCLGGSTGVNVAGAIRLAKQLGPGHTIVTVLCDCGTRYQSKLFNPGVPALQELAGAGMARAPIGYQAAVCLSAENHMPTDCLFRDDSVSRRSATPASSPLTQQAASCSTARCSTPRPAASRAIPAR